MVTSRQLNDSDGDRYFSGQVAGGPMIYIGPITRDQLQDAGIKGRSTGYYLCEYDANDPIGGLDVLASFTSVESAYRLAEALGLYEIDTPVSELEDPLEPTEHFSFERE